MFEECDVPRWNNRNENMWKVFHSSQNMCSEDKVTAETSAIRLEIFIAGKLKRFLFVRSFKYRLHSFQINGIELEIVQWTIQTQSGVPVVPFEWPSIIHS